MTSVQADFSGGINAFRDETKLADNEFILAKNVRSRTGALEGIKEPVEYPIDYLTTIPADIVALGVDFINYDLYILKLLTFKGNILAVVSFINKNNTSGKVALFKQTNINGMWKLVKPTSDWVFAYLGSSSINTANLDYYIQDCNYCEIPASSEFVKRSGAGANPYSPVTYGAIHMLDKTEAGLLIVINSYNYVGNLLTSNAASFLLTNIGPVDDLAHINSLIVGGWTTTNRIYVPATECNGLAYSDGILYWVGKNKTDIYRSVQGRPLDFVVNIKADGTPGETLNVEETTAYSVSANDITCIKALTTGQIFVATRYESYFIEPNYDDLIFGEVTFNKSPAFKTGVINQDCMIELPTDLALIIPESGIRSFNAVSQNKMRGRNSVFSLKIDKLLDGITQTALTNNNDLPDNWYLHPSAIVYDNYAFFSVKTKEGAVVMVYDTLTESWTSMDDYFDSSITQIRNFAIRDLTTSFELWAQTGDTVYQLFGSASKFECELRPRALSTQVPSLKGQHANVFMVFQGGTDKTEVRWVEFVDGKRAQTVKQQLQITNSGIPYPVVYPVMFTEQRILNDIKFNLAGLGNRGWKFHSRIYWPGDAKLLFYQVDVAELPTDVGPLQQNASYRE